ncbi:unnamed protein product [Rhizophagus irregularis]|nr:unnamed protein product [Rhizophagus irregularis]
MGTKEFPSRFIKLDGPHSSANIKEVFLKSLSSYNIESKAVEDKLSKKFIQFESKDKHVHCLAHVMNLAAQQAFTTLKAIEDNEPSNENSGGNLIHKLRTLIKKIKAFLQQQEKFKAQCKVANISNLNVILDVRTRWNLTYDMLMRARILKEPINTLSNSDQNLCALSINEEEWVRLSEIKELLKKAAINAINKLKEYYNKTNTTLYTVSLILDPRLKLEYMKDNEWEKCELDRYLKADHVQPLTNVLKWWKLHEEEYPYLANMAKDYLGVPATSAPSERIFSSAVDVITYNRASLAPETVRSVMCLKYWYRLDLLA